MQGAIQILIVGFVCAIGSEADSKNSLGPGPGVSAPSSPAPGDVCGGILGVPCDSGEFCKLNTGECCCDFQGVCTVIPQACPDNWDPVCGCDGLTYGNECEAEAAGVSVNHPGPCAATETGACCMDVSDGPIHFDTCAETSQDTCNRLGGSFQGVGSVCQETQACCLGPGPGGFCGDVEPNCCIYSGGVPVGPGSTCEQVNEQGGCPQRCGGLVWTPCENPDEFCRTAIGACCCDIWGLCTPIPDHCPANYDPVCGCDGVTYSNDCLAAAAGMSIDHPGPCEGLCEPDPDVFGCVPAACSPIPEATCLPSVIHIDIATGALTAVACDCFDDGCHVEFGNATAFPVGNCPADQTCEVFGTDTDNDGIDDQFTAGCVPDQGGACCVTGANSPITFEVCTETSSQDACSDQGGVFQGVNTECVAPQACCLGLKGGGFCHEIDPKCCLASGGVPLGAGSTCPQAGEGNGCPQLCGGIASLPCDDPDAFCKTAIGACCCDHFGVCTPTPDVCPAVYDPVCGCDGQTYGNECEADMAGISVDHEGRCGGQVGDFDDDGDADVADFYWVQRCMNWPPTGDCAAVDLDGNGVIDLADHEMFAQAMNGPQ